MKGRSKRSATNADVDAAAARFHKSERTIQRILSRWGGGDPLALSAAIAGDAGQSTSVIMGAFAMRATADLTLIEKWLSPREQDELAEVSIDIVRKIATDRAELAQLRRRLRKSPPTK